MPCLAPLRPEKPHHAIDRSHYLEQRIEQTSTKRIDAILPRPCPKVKFHWGVSRLRERTGRRKAGCLWPGPRENIRAFRRARCPRPYWSARELLCPREDAPSRPQPRHCARGIAHELRPEARRSAGHTCPIHRMEHELQRCRSWICRRSGARARVMRLHDQVAPTNTRGIPLGAEIRSYRRRRTLNSALQHL